MIASLKQRISALESKPDKDTVYNDSEIKIRLETWKTKPGVDTSSLVTKQELNLKVNSSHNIKTSWMWYAKKSETNLIM